MNTYTVVWTYVANYHIQAVKAKDPATAVEMCTAFFDEDFKKNGHVYVFEGYPLYEVGPRMVKAAI